MVSVCAIGNKSLQLVNPRVNAVNIIMINCTIGTKRELCSAKYKALWANSVPYELIKNTDTRTSFLRLLRPMQLLISFCLLIHTHICSSKFPAKDFFASDSNRIFTQQKTGMEGGEILENKIGLILFWRVSCNDTVKKYLHTCTFFSFLTLLKDFISKLVLISRAGTDPVFYYPDIRS